MRVVEIVARPIGMRSARALQQNAGDDLQAVSDAVLQFLEQDPFLAQQVVFELLRKAGFSDVGYRQENADMIRVGIVELVRIDDDAACPTAVELEVHLVRLDLRVAGCGGSQQGVELRRIPLTSP
jgi:hypothetical protein